MVTIILGFSVTVYTNVPVRNDVSIAATTLVQDLRQAAFFSRVGYYDSSWGVRVQNDTITLFQGASYAARNQNFDEIFEMSNIITSGNEEFVFEKLTGITAEPGDTTLTSSIINESFTITVNEKGIAAIK